MMQLGAVDRMAAIVESEAQGGLAVRIAETVKESDEEEEKVEEEEEEDEEEDEQEEEQEEGRRGNDNKPKLMNKRGIICMVKSGCTETHTNAMNGAVSWMYNYRQRIDVPGSPAPGVLRWANEKSIEFVPMIRAAYIEDISGTRCFFTSFGGATVSEEDRQKTPQCSMQNITDTFAQLNSEMVVKPKYLMGFNEPYVLHSHKEMAPVVAAEYYRRILIPVAAQFGYKLISPTSAPQDAGDLAGGDGLSEDKMGWLVDFLVACFKNRKATPSCDYTKIPVISLHKYTCKASVWDEWFGKNQKFKTILLDRLSAATPSRKAPGWKPYVDGLKFWVTETNCNWDGSRDNGPEAEVQCNNIRGKGGAAYGVGSLRAMEKINDIERYSWWNLYNSLDRQMTQVAKLTNEDGSLTPIGKAYRALSWKQPSAVKCT